MDAWESIGDSTMLRTYLQRAMSYLAGDGDLGVPVDRVGELFKVLNIAMPPSQLARLKHSLGIEEKYRECLSPYVPAYVPTPTLPHTCSSTHFPPNRLQDYPSIGGVSLQ